jgi:hypothetical protein
MAEFADRMNSLTRNLRSSIQMRSEARKHVHDATMELSNRNQAFMAHVADQNRTRAQELRESLAAHREECRQKAEALRAHHQESLGKMRDDLNGMLTETRKMRQDTVHQLFDTFQHARNELALDLREASFAWHTFAAGRDEPPAITAKPREKPGFKEHTTQRAAEPILKPREKTTVKARAAASSHHEKAPRKDSARPAKAQAKPSRGKR